MAPKREKMRGEGVYVKICPLRARPQGHIFSKQSHPLLPSMTQYCYQVMMLPVKELINKLVGPIIQWFPNNWVYYPVAEL